MPCELCNTYPHLTGCPDAPEREKVYTCYLCGEPIRDGEDYYEVPEGWDVCEGCIDDMSRRELMEFFGSVSKTAEAG